VLCDIVMPGLGGPALGAALARAEADWIAAGLPLDAAKLGAIADTAATAIH
jgi:hypothetical protein